MAMVVVQSVSFSPNALSELRRVDVIAALDEEEAGAVRDAIREKLRADPDAALVFLEVRGRKLVCHCVVEGERALVIDIEVRN